MSNKYLPVLLMLLIILLQAATACARAKAFPQATFYKNGKAMELTVVPDSVLQDGITLLQGCSNLYRMAVSDSLINYLKDQCTCLELRLGEAITFDTETNLMFRIERILIPFDGPYATDLKDKAAILFIGNSSYFSGPLGNKIGIELRARMLSGLRAVLIQNN